MYLLLPLIFLSLTVTSSSTQDLLWTLGVDTECGIVRSPEAIGLLEQEDNSRVVAGVVAARGSAPWMVRLYHIPLGRYFCGGSIVNSKWIITAAHCITVFKATKHNTRIYVADYDSELKESEERFYNIEKIVTHADFNDATYDADIAMIKLDKPISNFTHYVRPICLPTNNLTERIMKPRKHGRVSGWGDLRENGPRPRFMNEVYIPIVGQRNCISSTTDTVTDNMFCAGYKQKLKDACQGDSGGPFSILHDGRWYLFGIVSWGEGCGRPGKYGFYTRIPAFFDWINNLLIEEEIPCPPLETSDNVEGDCNRLKKPGQVCDFRCSEGHVRISGDVRRVCQLDGTWSGSELLCEFTECGIVTSQEALLEQNNRDEDSFPLVNERNATRGSAPWVVRIYHIPQRRYVCGGSILNSEWIVTSAYCLKKTFKYNENNATISYVDKTNTLIFVGDYDSYHKESDERFYRIEKIFKHTDFGYSTLSPDIAMIKLETPISVFTDYVRPICLPTNTETKQIIKRHKLGRVNGWGSLTNNGGTTVRFMNEIYLPIVRKKKCISSKMRSVTGNMLCIEHAQETDSCYGDDGGSFAILYEERWYLFGIVRWGEDCDLQGKYGVYTRIPVLLDWINNVIETNGVPFGNLLRSKPMNATVNAGDNHVFSCTPIDYGNHFIKWEKDDDVITKDEHIHILKGEVIIITKITSADAGKYTCVVMGDDQIRVQEESAFLTVESDMSSLGECGYVTSKEAILEEKYRDENFGRLVNGNNAARGSAPWMVRLYHIHKRLDFCGGSILNSEWIATAANCVTSRRLEVNKNNTLIRVADHDVYNEESEEKLYKIKKIVTHTNFSFSTFDADIAMIKLETPIFNFTDYVRPICLPTSNLTERIMKPRQLGRVNGWGIISDNQRPRFLNEIYVPIVGKKKCISSTGFTVTRNMFCAGYAQIIKDACTGDSGGPFSMLHKNRWYLFGIVSWGEATCGKPGKYGFYTRIPAVVDWINNVMKEE